jgi:hypothetical protein
VQRANASGFVVHELPPIGLGCVSLNNGFIAG